MCEKGTKKMRYHEKPIGGKVMGARRDYNVRTFRCLLLGVSFMLMAAFGAGLIPSTSVASSDVERPLVYLTTSFDGGDALPGKMGTIEQALWQSVYEYLIYRDPKTGKYRPGLAQRWEISDDTTKITLHLQEGVQFHDGWGELTAEDVKYTMEREMAPDSVNFRARLMRETIENIEIKDKYTMVINLGKPSWAFFKEIMTCFPLGFGVACKKYIETVGEEKANREPIGTGPYKFVERRAGDFVRLQAVGDHWRKTPEFKNVTMKVVAEETTRVAMLRAGEADIASVTTERVPKLRELGYKIITNPGGRRYYVVFPNCILPSRETFDPTLPWWADPADKEEWERARKVRKAMTLAVDNQQINKTFFKGLGTLYGLACAGWPGIPGYDPEEFPPRPYNPEQAKKLLAEAGYPEGFEITMIILTHGGRPECPDLCEAVAMYWENIGLTVKRLPMEFPTLRPQQYARNVPGAWVYGSPWRIEPFSGAMGINYYDSPYLTGFEWEKKEEIVKKGYYEVNFEKRMKLTREYGKLMYENYTNIPLVAKPAIWAASDRVGDWPLIPGYGYDFEYLEYITKKK
jgi:peptide/nickel transport system substrate-binding protein